MRILTEMGIRGGVEHPDLSWEEDRWAFLQDDGFPTSMDPTLLETARIITAAAEPIILDEDGGILRLPPYFISYTKKRKFARLHVTGGCAFRPGFEIKDYEYCEEFDTAGHNDYCHKCWPKDTKPDRVTDLARMKVASKGRAPIVDNNTEDHLSSSSSGSSSDTESSSESHS